MKTKLIKKNTVTMMAVLAIAIALISSCNKENKVELLAASNNTGTDVINASIGGIVPPTYTSGWKMDKSHSSVKWETQYYAAGAALTGRFNMFNAKVYFDQANPANTKISGWVQLSTFNTGEPGRDAYGKSGPNYMGVIMDTVTKSPLVLMPRASTDTAWFKSTSCEKFGNGYLVKGDFKFRGLTKTIEMTMTYSGKKTFTSSTTGKKNDKAGLVGKFNINALTVFGVPSGSISDIVTITVDCNMVTLPYD